MFKLLDYEELPAIMVHANFSRIWGNKTTRFPILGHLSFWDVHGTGFTLPVSIQSRGKTRFLKCEIPPIQIRMDKESLKLARIKDYPKLKTVLPCTLDEMGDEYLFRELLVYKLYEQVSDFAFKTQAVKLIHLDSASLDTTLVSNAFFIESDKEFRKRKDFEEVDQYNLQWEDLHPRQSQIMAVFQFMIGNTDWKIDMKHNMKYFRVAEGEPIILMPYDFDFSGVVSSPIAKVNPDIGQKKIRDRFYLGKSNEHLPPVLDHFKSQKAALLTIVEEFYYLDENAKADIHKYLLSFFEILENKKKCRKAFR